MSTDSHCRSQDSLPPTGSSFPSSEVTSSSPHTTICPLLTSSFFNPADPLLISLPLSALDLQSWLNEQAPAKCESCAMRTKQEGGEKRKTSNLPSTLPSCCKAVSYCFSSATTSLLLIFLNLPPLSLILCVAIYTFNPFH